MDVINISHTNNKSFHFRRKKQRNIRNFKPRSCVFSTGSYITSPMSHWRVWSWALILTAGRQSCARSRQRRASSEHIFIFYTRLVFVERCLFCSPWCRLHWWLAKMLDFFAIFSKGGIVLWCFQGAGVTESFTGPVNALIRSVILQVTLKPDPLRRIITNISACLTHLTHGLSCEGFMLLILKE